MRKVFKCTTNPELVLYLGKGYRIKFERGRYETLDAGIARMIEQCSRFGRDIFLEEYEPTGGLDLELPPVEVTERGMVYARMYGVSIEDVVRDLGLTPNKKGTVRVTARHIVRYVKLNNLVEEFEEREGGSVGKE